MADDVLEFTNATRTERLLASPVDGADVSWRLIRSSRTTEEWPWRDGPLHRFTGSRDALERHADAIGLLVITPDPPNGGTA